MESFVSVIVPTYKDWSRLELCIEALNNQTYPQRAYEVIIINNKPEDDFYHVKLPSTVFSLINEGKPGSYSARNAGLKMAKGDIIGFTDSDCIPDKCWIENAVQSFKSSQEVFRVGGKIRIFPKIQNKPSMVEKYESVFAFQQEDYIRSYHTCVTGNMFSRKEVFDKVGVFDDNLFSGGDFEWGKRAFEGGFGIVYDPQVLVHHPARETFEELALKSRRVAGGHFDTQIKRRGIILFGLIMIKKMLPAINEIKMIFSRGDLSFISRLQVYFIRYRLQCVYTFTLFKLKIGQKPERF